MTTILRSLRTWLAPLLMATVLIGGAVAATTSPLLVDTASAQSLTTDDLIDDDFAASTGLGNADLKQSIGNLIRVLLGFLGVIAVCIVLYGGFVWMTAGGSEDKVKKAQQIIVAGAIGLAIILSAWAITTFVISEFFNATSGTLTE